MLSRSVVALLVEVLCVGVFAFEKRLTTSGNDVTFKVELTKPLNLYGDYHPSLFVHARGFIALGKKDVQRVDVNRFQQDKLIVPYYNEIYLRKTVLIRTTSDAQTLKEFTQKVRTHFSDEVKFEAQEVLAVTWNVYVQFSEESMQTISLLIGSSSEKSYVEINYQHSQSKLYENFLYYVYGTAISGFSAGDGVRYHRIYGKFTNDLFTDILSKRSNIASPGRWMFKLGDQGGINKNFAVRAPDAKLEGSNVVDNDECTEGVSNCHESATCSNQKLGYICQCGVQYIGNGKICLKKDFRVYVRGSINGHVNGHDISESDHTILVQPSGIVAITVIPLKEQLGEVFRLLPMIHGLIPWLFAKSDSLTYGKGFDIVGDRIVAKTLINFIGDPSELYITQKIKGFANGRLSLHTDIHGNTPNFGEIKDFDLSNITEVFAESTQGSTSSISLSDINVNGKTYRVKVSRLIIYEPSLKKTSDLKHQLHINFDAATYSSYSTRSGLYMKFDANIKNIKKVDKCKEDNPCGKNSKCVMKGDEPFCVCNEGYKKVASKCVAQDCREAFTCGKYMNCAKTDKGYECVCDPGFKKKGSTCVAQDCRGALTCGKYMNCAKTDKGYECVCDPGFEKKGSTCTDVDECSAGRNPCERYINTRCTNKVGSYSCECVQGYEKYRGACRDVDECQNPVICSTIANSVCRNKDGGFHCDCRKGFREVNGQCAIVEAPPVVCKDGFRAVGGRCEDINECAGRNVCDRIPNAKCVNMEGSYTCKCNAGFKRTDGGCAAQDCRNAFTCGKYMNCAKTDGGYKCVCDPGFEKKGSACVDIDECKSGPCRAIENSVCVNKAGTYGCGCRKGFKQVKGKCESVEVPVVACNNGFHRVNGKCEDVNECEGRNVCERYQNSQCVNKQGTYICKCNVGFKRTAEGCQAIDNCIGNPCGAAAQCVNKQSGFNCLCNPGFTKSGSLCVDVDECQTDVCKSVLNSKCVNSRGSYSCPCKEGYEKKGKECTRKRAAAKGTCTKHSCPPNWKCVENANGFACFCNSGFELQGERCADIDECKKATICDLHKNTKCVNRVGGYTCECKTGYKNVDGVCVDINECELPNACDVVKNAKCANRLGSYTCLCKEGYRRTSMDCIAETNCDNNPCGANSRCVNTDKGFDCECMPGFVKSGSLCMAVRNCQSKPCAANSRCVDIKAGGYTCVCDPGFRKHGSTCEDIDECSNGDACLSVKYSRCVNERGSYSCVCNKGFKRTGNGCEASIKEVDCRNNRCRENAKCVGTNGVYACVCETGFARAGSLCIDKDECSNPDVCRDQKNSRCINKMGSYTCECNPGYEKRVGVCTDIDECQSGNVCDSIRNSKCVNRLGSYTCECKDGFKKNGAKCEVDTSCRCGPREDCYTIRGQKGCRCKKGYQLRGGRCLDIDECRGAHSCSGNFECVNNVGGYTCECKQGFKPALKECIDIDECVSEVCGSRAKCRNTVGSYTCQCNNGYRMVGAACGDIDECSERSFPCGRNALCENTDGGYQCNCKLNYIFAANGFDCEKACRRCLNGGKCIGKSDCQCAEGFSGGWCQYKSKDDFLLFAQSGSIKRLSIPVRSKHFGYLHTKYGNNIIGTAYDCKERLVYYTDATAGTIGQVTYNGLNDRVIIDKLKFPEGVSVDWLGRNIFWSDSTMKTINVASINGHYRKVLFNEVDKPRGILVLPSKGKLYWTDWVRSNPRIECSNMDGSERQVLVDRTLVKTPNGLSYNVADDELCWTDAGKKQIACVQLTASKRTRVLVKELPHPFSLAFHGGHMFWTDWKSEQIQRMNVKKNKRFHGLVPGLSNDGRLYDIKAVSKCPEASNACSQSNGECQYLCLMKGPSSRTCVKPDNLKTP